MVFALGITASAVGSSTLNGVGAVDGSLSNPVRVIVEGVQSPSLDPVYYLTITWDSMDFTYDFKETSMIWNPEDHDYDISAGAAGWTLGTGQVAIERDTKPGVASEVTVTNHSNVPVQYTAQFQAGADLAGVSVSLTGENATENVSTKTLATGVGRTFVSADYDTFTVEVVGAPTARTNATTTIKTVTITLVAP